MRLDVRDATIRAAENELRENNCYVVLVSAVVVEELRDKWSPPVELTIATEGGIAEITIREAGRPSEEASGCRGRPAPDYDSHIDYPERYTDGLPI